MKLRGQQALVHYLQGEISKELALYHNTIIYILKFLSPF